MNKTHLLPLALFWAMVTPPAHAWSLVGSGNVVNETRPVADFHGVELHGWGKVAIAQGDTEKLVIEAEDNLLPLIESAVDDKGVLRLGFKPHEGSIDSKKDVVFHLTVKQLDQLAVDGSGDIRADALTAGSLALELHGSGGIDLKELKADAVRAGVKGSGNIQLAGHAPRQNVTVDGSGAYQAAELHSDDAAVEVNGSGEADIHVHGSLDATVNGSGEIHYQGGPKKVSKTVNGSGRIGEDTEKDKD